MPAVPDWPLTLRVNDHSPRKNSWRIQLVSRVRPCRHVIRGVGEHAEKSKALEIARSKIAAEQRKHASHKPKGRA